MFLKIALQTAPDCTINKHSGKYAPIPLNIIRSNTLSIKDKHFYNFVDKNCSKIYSKTHQIAPFKKNSRRGMPPNRPSKRVAL